ncbi:ATPase [Croceibacterium mercuriale]|uniref:ATP synthase subunit b n=1 Tax=Croceibacterium mercuriale TaxID=1572751 RepID=A0A0B2BWI4_9SPHN|nr:ATPase [Croceibacterium mercuriale]KHL25739.1 ATPase [Croceibacterium mercuriale]
MPQIEQLAGTYSSQIFWLLVIFALAFFIIGLGMLPRVMDTMADRDRRIGDDLAVAQAARDEADTREDAWRTREAANREAAHALVNEARDQSKRDAEQRLASIKTSLDARLVEAEQRIDAARSAAAAEIEQVASEATQDIVARVARIDVDADAAHHAVRKVMVHG